MPAISTYVFPCEDPAVAEAQRKASAEAAQQARRQAAEDAALKQAQADNQACVSYGFKSGTDSFAQCRLKLATERANSELAAAGQQRALAAQEEAQQAQQAAQKAQQAAALAGVILSRPAPQPYMMPTNPTITCNMYGNTATCR